MDFPNQINDYVDINMQIKGSDYILQTIERIYNQDCIVNFCYEQFDLQDLS